MGHGIETTRDTVLVIGSQAWHGLADVREAITVEDAMDVARIGQVERVTVSPVATIDGDCHYGDDSPGVAEVEGRLVCVRHLVDATRGGLNYSPRIQKAPDGSATRRDDGSHLAVVTERYQPVNVNGDGSESIRQALEAALDLGYRIATVASLRDGTRMVGTLLSKSVATIPGDWDKTVGQVAFGWSWDSSMAPHVANRAMRNSCNNASELNYGSDTNQRFRSTDGVMERYTEALVQACANEELAFSNYVELATNWTEVEVSPAARLEFAKNYWPDADVAPNADATDRATAARRQKNVEKARRAWLSILSSDTIRQHGNGGRFGAGNAYGMWQATTEYMQHHHAVRARGVASQPMRRYERQTLSETGQDEHSAMALIAHLTDAPLPEALKPYAEEWADALA